MGYWATLARRALTETLSLTPWASPGKAAFSLAPPIAAAAVAFWLTGSPVQTGLFAIAATLALAGATFLWKLAVLPPRLAAEAAEALARATPEPGQAVEQRRRRQLVDSLARLYPLVMASAEPAVLAGLDLPPVDWLNEQLAERGEGWHITETRGRDFWTMELAPLTTTEKASAAARSGRAVF